MTYTKLDEAIIKLNQAKQLIEETVLEERTHHFKSFQDMHALKQAIGQTKACQTWILKYLKQIEDKE